MVILGIHDGHDAGCAVLVDGQLRAAAAEERFCRTKNYDARAWPWSFPGRSARAVLELAGVDPSRVDQVAVSFSGPAEDRARVQRLRGTGRLPEDAFQLFAASKRYRAAKLRVQLRRLGVRAPMSRIHHHRAHLLSAVATSGFESGWAISMDGKGDLLAGMVAQVGPPLRIRREISLLDSPGIFYSAITRLLGFRADEDEGKTTALAAGGGGSPRIDALLARELSWTGGDLRFHTLRGRAARAALVKLPTDAVAADLAAALGREGGADRGEIAAAAQRRLETVVVGLLDDAVADQGPVDLAVAGGVFANVSLNRVLSRHPAVRRLFVHPAMGDSGLAVGACVGAHQRLTGVIPALPLRDVFLGTGIEDAAVADLLSRRQIPFRRPAALAERVGRLLAAGATVGVCRGRMEYGPRALGHRSILCHPGDPQLTARLNASLGRSAVMPFAPAIADEQLSSCVDLRPEERRNAGFMTLAVPATRRLRDLCPAAVHVDGTARVQAVDRGTTPFLHGVIRAFGKRTGIPAVINTSLNRHREPIVRSAEDALRTASAAGLDALVLGEVLIDGTDLRGSGSGQTRQQR